MSYYKGKTGSEFISGLMHSVLGDYAVDDLEFVAAFDVDEKKVGKDLSEAIYAPPIALPVKIADVPRLGVEVMMGPVLDGAPDHLQKIPAYKGTPEYVVKVSDARPVDVVDVLRSTRTDVLVNVIPTGAGRATRFYADAALKEARAGFVNGIPEFIACDSGYQKVASANALPIIGDDVKSQLGASILHRTLLKLFMDRGVKIKDTYQLNYAGDTDFVNLVHRGETKEVTKLSALESLVPYKIDTSVGFGFIRALGDRKIAIIHVTGEKFGGVPVEVETKLTVIDGYNSAGVLIDCVRCAKIAMDRRIGGPLLSASACFMKHPPKPFTDEVARQMLEEFIKGRSKE
ncbi:MAG: inositol-3-phosphate synthase [Candidatus Bathyarchaeia archaeon]